MEDFDFTSKNTDAVSRYNSLVDEATNQAAKVVNKYGKPKYIAALIEIVISATAIIGIQIVAMGFDFSKLTTPEFWIRTLSLTACIFLLYRAVINARFEHTSQRDNVIEVMTKYKELSNAKELDMKDFLQEFNLNSKIGVYVSKINKRINRLERKKIRTYNAKRKMALTAKINTLREEIKPARIKEVIDIVRVKYYMVFYDDFENIERVGGNGAILTRGTQAYNKAFTKASFNKMWVYILCSAIMAVSVWSFGEATTVLIIANVLSSLLMIVVRIATAFVEADRIYDSTITSAYVCKIDILKQYQKWKEEKPKQVEKEPTKEEIKEEVKPIQFNNTSVELVSNTEVA